MRGHQKQFHCQSPMEWSWTDHGRGPEGTEPVQLELQGSNHTWEWCGIVCNLAAKLFACKLCDIIEMACSMPTTIFFSQAFNLSLSLFINTSSPPRMGAAEA